jgi:hypothetical protein
MAPLGKHAAEARGSASERNLAVADRILGLRPGRCGRSFIVAARKRSVLEMPAYGAAAQAVR